MPANHVTIFEVGPRDGLQNEPQWIETKDKIRLANLLSAAGLKKIEVTSFVSPKWVPQMRDAAEVMGGISRQHGTNYTALTPNLRGYEAAKAAKADEVAIFAAASEAFSQKNINCSIAESIERFRPIMSKAQIDGVPVRGYVSCVTHCPYAGSIAPEAVARVCEQLLEIGCYEISLGDTIGAGTPASIQSMLRAVLKVADAELLAGHFHDTRGQALANIEAALEFGLRTFDSSAAGLGGCPYAPGAQGNVATEAVVGRLGRLGYVTSIDEQALGKAVEFAAGLVSKRQ